MNEEQFRFEEPASDVSAGPKEELAAEHQSNATEAAEPSMASKWKEATARWAKESSLTYLSNPAARRDFVVQFRGNRSAWLFGIYVLALGVVSLFEYYKISGIIDPMWQRREMETFEEVLFVSLALIISLVTPALSATAILAEKQRKSIDLVFVAPIRPRTYLIGKILASYRYTWILLALSLPFTAMSVIMGGASWGDIITAYFLLSLQGVIFTSIGLYFSSMVEKVFSALIYTYAAVIAYCYATLLLGVLTGTGTLNSFWFGLNPFSLLQAAGSFTNVFGVPIPNFAIATAVGLLMIRIVLGAAGNLLTAPSRPERARLRGTAILSFGALAAAVASQTAIPAYEGSNVLSLAMCLLLAPLVLVVPFQACYGLDGETANKPNGMFKLKGALTGTPAGALPFIYSIIGAGAAGTAIGALISQGSVPSSLPLYTVYMVGVWTFVWSLARFASSFLQGLKASRALQFLLTAGAVGLPIPILMWMDNEVGGGMGPRFPWSLSMLSPLMSSTQAQLAFVHGLVWLAVGGLIAWWSETNLAKRMNRRKVAKMSSQPVLAGGTMSPLFEQFGKRSPKARGKNRDNLGDLGS